jgi:hypothetical protein
MDLILIIVCIFAGYFVQPTIELLKRFVPIVFGYCARGTTALCLAFTSVMIWPFVKISHAGAYLYYLKRNDPNLRTVVTEQLEYTDGALVFENGEFYMKVLRPNGVLMVKLNNKALFAKQMNANKNQTEESLLPYSQTITTGALPKGQVVLRSGSRIIGYGARASIDGVEGLLTAAHVLRDMKKCPERTIGSLDKEYVFDDSWNLRFYSIKADVAFVEVPKWVWARIEIPLVKLGSLPVSCAPITIGRVTAEGVTLNKGMIVKRALIFKHTASTTYGTSGAPIFSGSKVIGIHIRGDTDHNVGVALDPFVKEESDIPERSLTEMDYIPDGEDYAVVNARVDGKLSGYVVRTKNTNFHLRNLVDRSFDPAAGKIGAWADIDFEDDDFAYQESSRPESGLNEPSETPVFRPARVRGSQPTSELINGDLQKQKKAEKRRAYRTRLSLRKKEEQVAASEGEKGKSVECQRASPTLCQNSKNGTGQKWIPKRSRIASTSTTPSSREESGLVDITSSAPQESSSKVTLRSGRIPKPIREFLSSLKLNPVGKNRLWLQPNEVQALEKMNGNALAKEALKWTPPYLKRN